MSSKIRVLLVDDHPVIRMGLRAILDKVKDIELVGEAVDGVEAVSKALRQAQCLSPYPKLPLAPFG